MAPKKVYNVLLPSLENAGPTNIALDIADTMRKSGSVVNIFYLNECGVKSYLTNTFQVKKLTLFDAMKMRGVLHSHGLRPDVISCFIKLLFRKVKSVNTIHIHFITDMKFLYSRFLTKIAFRIWFSCIKKFDCIVCISNTMKNYYIRYDKRLKIKVIYNFRNNIIDAPCDASYLDWIKMQRLQGRVIVSYVGSLIDRKNILNLVEYISTSTTFSLVIFGAGEHEKAIVNMIGNINHIKLHGFVSNVRDYIKYTDLMVLPSYAEGFPLVVLESLSVGLPVLLSNILVHREIASMGFGEVFDHKSFLNFQEKANDIIFNKKSKYSVNSIKANYQNVLSPEFLSDKYVELINGL